MPPLPPVATDTGSTCRSGSPAPPPPQPAAQTIATAAASGRRTPSDRRGRPQLRVERVALGDRGDLLRELRADGLEARLQRLADDAADVVELVDADAAGGERAGADAQARGDRR